MSNQPATSPIRILIADDHKLFREGLRSILEREPGFEVVGEARDGQEAVDLAKSLLPDVVLMDLEMPRLSGIEAIREIKALGLESKVLALSNFGEDERVYAAMLAGARGYIVKRIGSLNLIGILRAVQNDEFIISPYIAQAALRDAGRPGSSAGPDFGLTQQEVRILEFLARGLSNKEISARIYISVDTVKAHLKHIFEKLGVDSRTKAAVLALKHNLVAEPRTDD